MQANREQSRHYQNSEHVNWTVGTVETATAADAPEHVLVCGFLPGTVHVRVATATGRCFGRKVLWSSVQTHAAGRRRDGADALWTLP